MTSFEGLQNWCISKCNRYLLSGDLCTATLVTNQGSRYSNIAAVKINANTYVFGKNTEGYLKMVAVDSLGMKIESRTLGPENSAPKVLTKETWDNGIVEIDVDHYNVEDVSMDCIGV